MYCCDNPMADPGAIQKRYEPYTPCRKCLQRVEDLPSLLTDVCAECVEQVCLEAQEILYDMLIEEDYSIISDIIHLNR